MPVLSPAAPPAGVTGASPWHPPRLSATSQIPIVAPYKVDITSDRAPGAVVRGHAQCQGQGRSDLISPELKTTSSITMNSGDVSSS